MYRIQHCVLYSEKRVPKQYPFGTLATTMDPHDIVGSLGYLHNTDSEIVPVGVLFQYFFLSVD